jgi:hypothetical protein
MSQKEYLGDGVYIAPDEMEYGFWLTTENGICATNKIFLEPKVIEHFEEYLKQWREETKS